MARCWAHANISRSRKILQYNTIVRSKPLYSLDSLWLLQGDLHRLDAFHHQCLRKNNKIPPSYVSRISNKQVLEAAHQGLLSDMLQRQQVKFYNRIAKLPEDNLLRKLTCMPGSVLPRIWDTARRRGRPRQQWAACIYALSQARAA